MHAMCVCVCVCVCVFTSTHKKKTYKTCMYIYE